MEQRADQYKRPLLHKRVDAKHQVSIERDETAFQGYRVCKMGELNFPLVLEKEEIIVDFGNHYTGYLHIELENGNEQHIADSPTNIAFSFAEMPIELMEGIENPERSLSVGWLQNDFKTVVFMPYSGSLERRYSFRYLKLKRLDSVFFPVKITALYIDSVSAVALENAKPAKIDDSLLRQIDILCLNTLKECEQDVFEDGPKRDRRLWIGDLRLQAQLDYITFRNIALIKRSIYLFADHLNSRGLVAPCVFPDTPPYVDEGVLLDYSLCLVLCLYDYLENTGDTVFAEELYDIAIHQIEFVADYLRSDSRNINNNFFIDHAKHDKTIAALGYYLYVLRHGLVLAERLGKAIDRYHIWIEEAEKDLLGFYSLEKELFVSPNGEISWHSQIWAVLSGSLDPDRARKLLVHTAETDPDIRFSSPFMTHYYLEALYRCDMKEAALRHIKEYWGAMLDAGFDCCPECFMPKDEHYSPYAAPVLNSACHAWSCTAAYWIRRYHCSAD